MVKQTDFVVSVAGMVGCGITALLDPHAWEIATWIGSIFFGCAMLAGLEL
jgi:hypothetical protein